MNIMHLLFSFEGRIRRLHYWLAAISLGVIEVVIISVVGALLAGAAMSNPNNAGAATGALMAMMPIYFVVLLIFMWPTLALGVKRCHDRDKTGWFLLIGLIPLIGAIWLLIDLGFLDGTQGPNKYGPSPKGIGASAATPAAAG
ncbi:MAG: DUF805 domain-containing protein [Caulobacterales bacterium]